MLKGYLVNHISLEARFMPHPRSQEINCLRIFLSVELRSVRNLTPGGGQALPVLQASVEFLSGDDRACYEAALPELSRLAEPFELADM